MEDFKLIRSKSHDPSYNLALEEYLIEQKEPVIYLWSNNPTVVIGRNQNPYKECNLKKMNEDGVNLMRRRSGGGAVYHDLGNLNFTIISKKNPDVVEQNFNLVIAILKELGVEAKVSGRNDLEVNGKKISGSAFFEDEEIFCHHATLLINVDTSKMAQYLTASKLKLESKGVDSVKSRVANLKDFNSEITVPKIIELFSKICNKEAISLSGSDISSNPKIRKIIDIYRSWDWTYGDCIDYNVELKKKYSWGLIEIDICVVNGIIEHAKIYTDSIIIDNFETLEESLIGVKFNKDSLIEISEKVIKNNQIKSDLTDLFDIN